MRAVPGRLALAITAVNVVLAGLTARSVDRTTKRVTATSARMDSIRVEFARIDSVDRQLYQTMGVTASQRDEAMRLLVACHRNAGIR